MLGMTDGFERPHVKARDFLGIRPQWSLCFKRGGSLHPPAVPVGFVSSALRAFSNRETEAHAIQSTNGYLNSLLRQVPKTANISI